MTTRIGVEERGDVIVASHEYASPAPAALAPSTWKGRVTMHAPVPAEDRAPRVSRVIAEALVQRQGPRRIVKQANRLGLPPTLTQAVVVACAASALDSDIDTGSVPARQRPVGLITE